MCISQVDGEVWSGSSHNSVYVHSALTGQFLRSAQAPGKGDDDDYVCSILRVDSYVWCGGNNGTITIFNSKTVSVTQLKGHTGSVGCLTESPCFVWSGSGDRTVRAWDKKTGKSIFQLAGHTNWVKCIASVGTKVWSGSDDCSIRIWDETTGEAGTQLVGHTGGVLSLLHVGTAVWSGSADKTIKLWDSQTGRSLRDLQGHTGWVNALAFKEGVVWSGSNDKTIRGWNSKTHHCIRILTGHRGSVWCMTSVTNSPFIWSGGGDALLCMWNTSDPSPTPEPRTGSMMNVSGAQLSRSARSASIAPTRISGNSADPPPFSETESHIVTTSIQPSGSVAVPQPSQPLALASKGFEPPDSWNNPPTNSTTNLSILPIQDTSKIHRHSKSKALRAERENSILRLQDDHAELKHQLSATRRDLDTKIQVLSSQLEQVQVPLPDTQLYLPKTDVARQYSTQGINLQSEDALIQNSGRFGSESVNYNSTTPVSLSARMAETVPSSVGEENEVIEELSRKLQEEEARSQSAEALASELEAALEASRSETAKFRESMQLQREQFEKEKQAWKAKADSQLQVASSRMEDQTSEIQELQDSLSQLNEDLAEERRRYNAEKSENIRAFQAEKQELQERVKQLNTQIAEERRKFTLEMTSSLSQHNSVSQEMQQRLAQQTSLSQELQQRVAQLTTQISEEKRRSTAEIAGTLANNQDLQQRIAQLTAQLSEEKKKHIAEIAARQEQQGRANSELHQQVNNLTSQLADVKKRHAEELSSLNTKYQAVADEKLALQTELSSLRRKMENLSQLMQASDQSNKGKILELQKLAETQVSSALSKADEYRSRVEELEAKNSSLSTELTNNREAYRAKFEEIVSQNKTLELNLRRVQEESNKTERSQTTLSGAVQTLKSELESTKRQLQAEKELVQQLKIALDTSGKSAAQVHPLRQALDENTRVIRELQAANTKLKNELLAASKTIVSLEGQLSSKSKAGEELKSAVEAEFADLEAEQKNEESERKKLEQSILELKSNLDSHRSGRFQVMPTDPSQPSASTAKTSTPISVTDGHNPRTRRMWNNQDNVISTNPGPQGPRRQQNLNTYQQPPTTKISSTLSQQPQPPPSQPGGIPQQGRNRQNIADGRQATASLYASLQQAQRRLTADVNSSTMRVANSSFGSDLRKGDTNNSTSSLSDTDDYSTTGSFDDNSHM
ncbi:F-box and WD-40 domain protein MET30 [Pelomyxa schiedti]|nr:F-box and WD-40 domain protein MET30 [Pelomyxa schiedti]